MAKILLVDDDTELTDLLSELLSIEGFEMEVAGDGEEGLAKLNDSHDLILLDIMMPQLNGLDMLKRLRLQYDTPVLMLTARGNDEDRILGFELGADDYLPKPFNDRELIVRIKAILRRMGASKTLRNIELNTGDNVPQELNFNGLYLNCGQQQVFYQQELVDMTGTEFAFLEILVRNPGTVLSRELLSTQVLRKRLTPFDRSVDMHMSNIRKKLPERPNGLPWFKTLRGKGYLLVSEDK